LHKEFFVNELCMVDTSVWVDFFAGRITPQTTILRGMLPSSNILITGLILTEVLQGFRENHIYENTKKYFRSIIFHNIAGKRIAVHSAENYRFLRRKGITIRKTIDVIIGTYCIDKGIALLHNDRDFDPMEQYLGLKVVR
jgi:predicted nucleic acid-binding protein